MRTETRPFPVSGHWGLRRWLLFTSSLTLYTLLITTSTLSPPRWHKSRIHTTCVSSSSLAVAKISSVKIVKKNNNKGFSVVWIFLPSGSTSTWLGECPVYGAVGVMERAQEAWREAGERRVAVGILNKAHGPGIGRAHDGKIRGIDRYLLVYTCGQRGQAGLHQGGNYYYFFKR